MQKTFLEKEQNNVKNQLINNPFQLWIFFKIIILEWIKKIYEYIK